MKAPLSEDYGSTIHIADVSVCEAPVYKVTNWINNNEFTSGGDVLRSESLHSITTSEMITYICEKGKRNDIHRNSNTKSKQTAVDGDQMSESSSQVPSHLFEGGHKTKKSIKPESDDGISSDISENSGVPSHYLCERIQFVAQNVSDDYDDCSSQLSEGSEVPSHYLREAGHHQNRETSSVSVTTPSNDSISLCSNSLFFPEESSNRNNSVSPSNHINKSHRKPPNLFILKESSSVPLLTPKIVNPLFMKPNLGDSLSCTPLTQSSDKAERTMKMSNQQKCENSETPPHYFCEDKCCKTRSPYCATLATSSQCSNMLPFDSDTVSDVDASLLSVRNKEPLFTIDKEPEVLFTPLTTNPLFGNDTRPSLTVSFMPQPVNEVDNDPQNLNQDDDVFSQQSGSLSSSDIDVDDDCETENSFSPYYEKAACLHCSSECGYSQHKDVTMNANQTCVSHTPCSCAAASEALDLSQHDTICLEMPYAPKITNPVFKDKFQLDAADLLNATECKELNIDETEFETYDTDSQTDMSSNSDADCPNLGYWK